MMLDRRRFLSLAAGLPLVGAAANLSEETAPHTADVCVYGGTASGVAAALAAAREGWRVVIVEPGRWLGGMTGGGLNAVDWGTREAVGGFALRFFSRPGSDPEYRERFAAMLEEHRVHVVLQHRISKVHKPGRSIESIDLDEAMPDDHGVPAAYPNKRNAMAIRARMFIDCSYEGDLMAGAGVSYTYGRESKEEYGESLAGVRPPLWIYDIDPYLKPGDPQSGLLPLLQDREPGRLGEADKLTMGYCFRFKFDFEGEGIPIEPPDDYNPETFGIFRRGFRSGIDMTTSRYMNLRVGNWVKRSMNPYKTKDGNLCRQLLTLTLYGSNADYPDGDYETRSGIWRFHQDFVRGLTHFLRTDPSVPAEMKETARRVRLRRGPFEETGGWPHQLYVREVRRMVSSYVVTQKDLEGKTDPPDPVGLASYGVDDWPYATIPLEGRIALSGGEFSILYLGEKYDRVYKIPYRSIAPQQEECVNLLVPVCVSASHIAMTSIRMEPVYMILGESAGAAACLALENGTTVQEVDYGELRASLERLDQKLERLA